jgi:peptidoglycan/xylan/chitin deacetylase (PgdA/CDA1 family)
MRSYDSYNRISSGGMKTPFFSFHTNDDSEVVQRTPDDEDDWVKDNKGNLFYKKKEEAEARMKSLEEKGEWEEYKVESFKDGSHVYWRVLMRKPKKKQADKPADTGKESPKKDTPPKNKETPKEKEDEDTKGGGKTPPTPADPVFALTFDDGPHAAGLGKGDNRTENVLDVLKSESIKGAFFIQTGVTYRGDSKIGRQLVKRMATDGHTVGVHTGGTADHELHTKAEAKGTLKGELESAKKYIKTETGSDATLVRPPTGAYNKAVTDTYAKVSLTNLMWDIDGDTGADLAHSKLIARLDDGLAKAEKAGWKPWVQTASSRIVILYHDIQKGTAANIAKLIAHIRAQVKKLSGGKVTAKFDKP